MNRRQFLKALGITALAPVIPFESIRTILAEKVIPPATVKPLTDLNLRYAFVDYGMVVEFEAGEKIRCGDMVVIANKLAMNANKKRAEMFHAVLTK